MKTATGILAACAVVVLVILAGVAIASDLPSVAGARSSDAAAAGFGGVAAIRAEAGDTGAADEAKAEESDKSPKAPEAPPVIKYDGPTYYVIPMRGKVGQNILADLLEKSLEDALKRKPDVVILDINSGGGLIQEAEEIVAVIRRYNSRLRIVAFCDRSLSAAAVIAMSAKDIYLRPSGIIGAATAYKKSMFGLPEAIEEKFQSVWRATARSSAETGGHNPLLAEAMIDKDMQLCMVERNGRKHIWHGKKNKDATIISRQGRLLTLTAGEAVECGLAAGNADNYDDLGKCLGFEEWTECSGLGVPLADHWDKVITDFSKRLKKLATLYADNTRRASDAIKERGSYTYAYYTRSRRMTAKSQRKWRRATLVSVRFLNKARDNLKEAVVLAEETEGMEQLVDVLDHHIKDVKEEAAKTYRSAANYPASCR